MRVLITNHHLQITGGSETWTYTMAKECRRRGYHVDVATILEGDYAKIFNFCRVNKLDRAYDLIIVNHNTCLKAVKDRGIKGPIIFTCHGTTPALEQPKAGADVYVGVSEETVEHVEKLGFRPVRTIRNPIDMRKYYKQDETHVKLQRVLAVSDYKPALDAIKDACKQMGLEYSFINKSRPALDNERHIQWADLVVSLGRGALEAMSCGRNVVVYDQRAYIKGALGDGLVTPENAPDFLTRNMSGRHTNTPRDVAWLVSEFGKYDWRLGKQLRRYIMNEHEVGHILDKYIKIGEAIRETQSLSPVSSLKE